MNTPLRIGIVGPGEFAEERLAPAINRVPGAVLWSVVGSPLGLDRARTFAARHGARAPVPAHDDLPTFLADPALDAVIVASPDRLHARAALAAAAAGKHLLVEKPLATSTAEAEAVVDACRQADVRLGVGYHLHHHAGLQALALAVQEGFIGQLLHLRIAWTFRATERDNWRANGVLGRWWSLGATGTHAIDLTRWFMACADAGDVVEVRSLTSSPVHMSPHDETAVVLLRFESGATAEILSSVLFRAPRNVELYGHSGVATAEEVLGPHGRGRITVKDRVLPYEHQDPYTSEIADFVDAVRTGRDPVVCGEEGLANVRLLDRII